MKIILISTLLAGLLAACAPGATTTPGLSPTTAPQQPLAVTVRPPLLPVTTAVGPVAGWQTFSDAALQVAVDYPPDWSVLRQADGVLFSSPQGDETVLLQADQASEITPAAGQDCANVTNAYGQPAAVCFEAATFRYSAVFPETGAGRLRLSTVSRERPAVYYQMFDSLRPIQ